jgi:hypothetical protein
MTAAAYALLLLLPAVFPLGHFMRTLADTTNIKPKPESELARLTAPLAPAREDLTGEHAVIGRPPLALEARTWPGRQTPTDLAQAYTPVRWHQPSAELVVADRSRQPWTGPRHAAIGDTTIEFRAMTSHPDLDHLRSVAA